MNSKPVGILEPVAEDVQLVCDYVGERWPHADEQLYLRFMEVVNRIAANPGQFPVKFDDYHRALITKSYQAAYYFQEPERSVIVAVVDARRHPRLIRDLVRGRRERS